MKYSPEYWLFPGQKKKKHIINRQVPGMRYYHNEIRRFDDIDTLNEVEDFKLVPPNATIVLESGKKDKVRLGDILCALTGAASIESKYVGMIDIYDRQSYVAIDSSMVEKPYSYLKNGKIKGRTFSVWYLVKEWNNTGEEK